MKGDPASGFAVVVPSSAERVLDLGCGSGWVIASAQCRDNAVRVGIDVRQGVLAEGLRTYPNLLLAASDATRLCFADSTFDAVIAHVSLPYMNTARVLPEICRVLVPGGTVFLTLHSFHYLKRWARAELKQRHWRGFPFLAYVFLNGMSLHLSTPQVDWVPLRRCFETVYSTRGIRSALAAAGFANVCVEPIDGRLWFACTASKAAASAAVHKPVAWQENRPSLVAGR